MSKSALTPDVQDVALSLMEGLSCPRSVTVAILLRAGEWDQLMSLETDPSHYSCSESYFSAVASTDFLRKFQDVQLECDPEASALKKWWWAERECYKSNERLAPFLSENASPYGMGDDVDEAVLNFVVECRKEVDRLLGSRPPTLLEGRFGPGATMSDKSQASTVPDKMSSLPTLTPNAWPHLFPWSGTMWASASASLGNSPSFIRGNAFFSVPKTALTRRGCAKEPSVNGFYQLGLGRVMKKRLLSRGINLAEGQDIHRLRAKSASRDGQLATIDLSSASDTVCVNLVKLMLNPKWFELLDSLRSPYTLVGGKWVRLEKFSSMGNGYTFELETCLFAAIAHTACRGEVTYGRDFLVYGDDIIVPVRFAKDVISALKFFGFTPNEKKTFSEGSFRESCGGDFFDGVGVRPFSLEKDPDEPQKLISLANGIRRMARQDGAPPSRWLGLRRSWFKCLDLLPLTVRRCRGPEALGDVVIHDEEDRWDTRWRDNCIRYVRCYRPAQYRVIGWEGWAHDVQMAAALYRVSVTQESRDENGLTFIAKAKRPNHGRIVTAHAAKTDPSLDPRGIIPRDGVTGYKVGWVPFS